METFSCGVCGTCVEIEKIHLLVDTPEHVEFSQCKECFDKSVSDNA